MKKEQIVIISNERNYFFSTDHCQDHGLGDEYVPCTHHYPITITPNSCIPDGVVKSVEDLVAIFYYDMEEIKNPDQTKQPFI